MQYIVIARDGTDLDALKRRLAARDAHVEVGDDGVRKGNFLMGAAMLNDDGDMCGSVMLVDFSSRDALDAWLDVEPYVVGNVWNDIEIIPVKVGPSFEKFLPQVKNA